MILCNEHFWISFRRPHGGELIVRVTNQCRSSGRVVMIHEHTFSLPTPISILHGPYTSRITSAVTEIYYDRCDYSRKDRFGPLWRDRWFWSSSTVFFTAVIDLRWFNNMYTIVDKYSVNMNIVVTTFIIIYNVL